MRFTRDSFDNLEIPSLILCKGNHDRIGVIKPLTYEYTKNFSDLNQIDFSVAYKVDNELTPNYDLIDVMHFVEIKDVEFFLITSVSIQNEGTENETKEVTGTSVECSLGQKYLSTFIINMGTDGSVDGVSLYNLADKSHSLLHLALELAPEWEIAHVDASLQSMQRSFEIDRQDIYSFLMNDVATAFDCFFVFDTIHQRISVYSEENISLDTNIYASYNNLLEKTDMSCSTDDIKTCLELESSDETYGSIREINMGSNKIYNFITFNSTDYWSRDLYDAFNTWQTLVASKKEQYNNLLSQYQTLFTEINNWTTKMIPSTANQRNVGYGTFSIFNEALEEIGTVTWDKYNSIEVVNSLPSSTDDTILWIVGTDMYRYSSTTGMFNVNNWIGYGLAELNAQLSSAEQQQAVAIKAGYGEEDSRFYVSQYLIFYNTVQNIKAQIEIVEAKIAQLESQQSAISEQMNVIANQIAMENNFTESELKELSHFIREDQLSGDNYVVTDIMDDDERIETLEAFLDFANKELYKIAVPQMTFGADLLNLFQMPEFDIYSGEFDVGNYIWVTLRDDFNIKAKLLTMHIDFLDPTNFSVTFGNVYRKANNVYTAIQDAINTASSAATTVTMNRSYWTEAAKDTDDIGKMISDGLIAAGAVLTDGTASEMVIDERGIFVNTNDDSDYPNDSIFIGGGRIMFTDDDWKTVSEAVGRVTIKGESVFGVIAQAMIAGYIGGSEIVGTSINNGNGTFSVDADGNLTATSADIKGNFEAVSGKIGDFTIGTGIYNGKSSLTANTAGVYIGTDGISLGTGSTFKVTSDGKLNATSATITGTLTAGSGSKIGAFNVTNKAIYNAKSSLSSATAGVYVGTDGIALGANNTFQVTSAGALTAISGSIGGFTIQSSYLANGKTTLTDGNNGVYLGTSGIALGANSRFKVDNQGNLTATSATITGTITTNSLTATGGKIGGITISAGQLSASSSGGAWWIKADGTASFSNIQINGYASSAELNAVSARVGSLEVDHVSVSDLNAVSARVGSLEVDHVSVSDLNAVRGRVGSLEADHVSVADLNATNLTVANKIDANTVYADFMEVRNWTSAGLIKSDRIDANRIFTIGLESSTIDTKYLIKDGHAIGSASGYVIKYPYLTVTKNSLGYVTNVTIPGYSFFNFLGYGD